jgi:hypothetical protein
VLIGCALARGASAEPHAYPFTDVSAQGLELPLTEAAATSQSRLRTAGFTISGVPLSAGDAKLASRASPYNKGSFAITSASNDETPVILTPPRTKRGKSIHEGKETAFLAPTASHTYHNTDFHTVRNLADEEPGTRINRVAEEAQQAKTDENYVPPPVLVVLSDDAEFPKRPAIALEKEGGATAASLPWKRPQPPSVKAARVDSGMVVAADKYSDAAALPWKRRDADLKAIALKPAPSIRSLPASLSPVVKMPTNSLQVAQTVLPKPIAPGKIAVPAVALQNNSAMRQKTVPLAADATVAIPLSAMANAGEENRAIALAQSPLVAMIVVSHQSAEKTAITAQSRAREMQTAMNGQKSVASFAGLAPAAGTVLDTPVPGGAAVILAPAAVSAVPGGGAPLTPLMPACQFPHRTLPRCCSCLPTALIPPWRPSERNRYFPRSRKTLLTGFRLRRKSRRAVKLR